MKVIVTGGAGFIGSHLAEALIKEGRKVTVIDNLTTGFADNVPEEAEFYKMDIRQPEIIDFIGSQSFEAIFHLAAQVDVRISVAQPLTDMQVNIAGSLALLECCRRYNIKHFIFASSGGTVYGEQQYFPADEKHPLNPVSPYGIAKLAVEKYSYYYNLDFNINTTMLRLGNVYGPRQNPFGEAGVVAIFCRHLLDGKQPIINGDGLQTRDYVYIDDVVNAFVRSLHNKGFNAFNIGTGKETDVVTLFDQLNAMAGNRFKRTHRKAAPGEQLRSCIDPALAGERLGWKPKVKIEDGLKQTFEYFNQNLR